MFFSSNECKNDTIVGFEKENCGSLNSTFKCEIFNKSPGDNVSYDEDKRDVLWDISECNDDDDDDDNEYDDGLWIANDITKPEL